MKVKSRNIIKKFSSALKRLCGGRIPLKLTGDELPLRAELFSASQMEQHGRILAGVHRLKTGRSKDTLLARLSENEIVLREVHGLLTEDIRADRRITPAGEWLLDNFYVIEEQIRTAVQHLPKGYSRELPRLANAHLSGLPRVYDIALETIAHVDGRVDPESLSSFVSSYQSQTTLKLGELWAIPIMLRLALIENLRRVAARIASDRINRNCADIWAAQLTKIAVDEPRNLILAIADMARSEPPMVSSFVAELVRNLHGQGPALAMPLTWIEQRLSESSLTIEQLVRAENQQQAADQVSMSNSIGSLRFLSAKDWRKFVESMSIVEKILSEDPAGIYCKMDFTTRDNYRHVVEKIAKKSLNSESEVAHKTIQLAHEGAARKGSEDRSAHAGFYLIGEGLTQLEQMANMSLPFADIPGKICRRFPFFFYGGAILLLTAFFTVLSVLTACNAGVQYWAIALLLLPLLLCGSHLAVGLTNWLATLLTTPCILPRMDFSKGIPLESRTLVAVPSMLESHQNIEDLLNALEVRFLSNKDKHLHFALLTDFCDAEEEKMPGDEALLTLARLGIDELNQKYPNAEGDSFFLFHRPRLWNPQDCIWMARERKRGKLADLNGFLRSKAWDKFSLIAGNTSILAGVKYVITLDTDTQLARDSARQFIGAMAHPLNRAIYDEKRQRVVAGYGILQPRVAASLPGANRSRYARMCASEIGIDPYTRAVSDVYQDLFGEGSFIGKGIYDLDIFEKSLGGRFPSNRILSHDLLEGCYARAGLLSDVQLYEEHPSSYSADVKRRHRWIRGDWQIASWLQRGIPGPDASLLRNPLSLLSQWKILDNLRRSLTAAALTLILLLSWTLLPFVWFWTLGAIGIIMIPSLISSVFNVFRKPADVTLGQHLSSAVFSARQHFYQDLFTLVCLPYEAFFSMDAIMRVIWRLLITHKNLLQWRPSCNPILSKRSGVSDPCMNMWIGPFIAVAAVIYLAVCKPAVLAVAGPVLILWFVSPLVTWWISRPIGSSRKKLTTAQTVYLRKLSRKTWAFFETFVGPGDNWLPPDNHQEYPVAVTAHRTSPTNMGLALLANLSAYDFGTISAGQFMERTFNALNTMESLKRHQGHFFNWYDTKSLNPLPPLYISSVDSGNLAGHLMTLQTGLLAVSDNKIIGLRFFESLKDTLGVLTDTVIASPELRVPSQLSKLRQDLETAISSIPITLAASRQWLVRLSASAVLLNSDLDARGTDTQNSQLKFWAAAFARQCKDGLNELDLLAPWTELLSSRKSIGYLSELDDIPTLRELASLDVKFLPMIAELCNSTPRQDDGSWLCELQRLIATACTHAEKRIASLFSLSLQCERLARMDYDFLYDKVRHLHAIGYNVSECRRDSSYYDLLASEARFSCFVAIAQGQVPQESWFALSRLLTTAGGEPILLSWSGSMFEYLMPLLVMPAYENTLLDQTCRTAVRRQIEYGKKRGVPWGISECGYNAIDVHRNYQYRAFGVPGLGLKRGLSDDLVIAPYASVLALMVAPTDACSNIERLSAEGFESQYGFYEAIDYTPSRLPRGQTNAVVRSFMVHHQGMSFLALAHLLLERPMQKRFEANSLFQSAILLLQEGIPKATAFYAHTTDISEYNVVSNTSEPSIRIFNNPDTPNPEVQLLSNGRYHVMITNSGGGYSRWKDLAVTRWREDSTCDNWGTFCYIRDLSSRGVWSAAYQPTLKRSKHFDAIFSEGRAEFHCREHDYDTHMEIAVSPEDDIEMRRVRITNRTRTRRAIDITSYAEVVLSPPAADELHPAFSNLFVQTEILRSQQAILCTRRPRARSEQSPWMLHMMTVHGAETGEISYETDRMKFIGRGNTVANPQAMSGDDDLFSDKLSDTEGSVLDPIVAIRYRIILDAEKSATINIVSGIGESRESALNLLGKYQDRHLADRVFDLAWTHGQVLLRQLNASETDAQLYGRLAGSIIYANASLRADSGIIIKNRRGQSGLWGYAISGDLPIVLMKIEDPANINLVRQLVQAHAYWRLKGLAVDLVIWNEDHIGYRQLLHDQIMGLIAAGIETNVTDRPGGIFVRLADRIAEEDRILIQTTARVIISDSRGTLDEQISGRIILKTVIPFISPNRSRRNSGPLATAPLPRNDLLFYNGLGGFTPDGREYVITTAQAQLTPVPWVNVLANPHFGSVISESGLAFTWSENAHEFRLTPWDNDPVGDSKGEAFYLRDEASGYFWSPSPLPCRGAAPYVTRHGFGYSVFEHTENGIRSEMWVYVAMDASIKFTVLKIFNESDSPRTLSATGYAEWVLGDLRSKSAMHVITEIDPDSGAVFARNPYNTEFSGRTAFFDSDDANRTVTCDRNEFLGRNGSLRAPAAMMRSHLSNKTGAALDPCAAMQISLSLAPGEDREIIFKLGIGRDADDARNILQRFRGATAAREALDMVWQHWKHTLGAVNVETPDKSLNVLANGWLLYQTLACRLWARSATYQSGGAFGFRDQLQDVTALIHARPHLVREHLLLCASRQFTEGDVQHWWHPPAGRGVRTHCSDDYLWLPLTTCNYVVATGDTGILEETVSFLEGHPVKADEDSYYDLPNRSAETASLYKHCVRAIMNGLKFGEHGLPLIGSGDWNDGMNLIGEHGKGESVWLGFFLYDVLLRFTKIARMHGDEAFAELCEQEAVKLRINIERHGWDGEWYRRAFFDDGSPLGSSVNPECQIDSIAQSWSVLSGAGEHGRSRMAMNMLDERLVRREHGLIQLLDPPFDKSNLNPGYIKGYVPGVRENGGQYTHAAIWAIMAFARLGDNQRAWELFTMINPINHSKSLEGTDIYKVEPYVVAADVYAAATHTGRGGWTWYTGSAAWMYRLILESFLGLRLEVDKLRFTPCLPATWEEFKIHYRYRETVYHITVSKYSDAEMLVFLDGVEQYDKTIPLADDHNEHWCEVRLPVALV